MKGITQGWGLSLFFTIFFLSCGMPDLGVELFPSEMKEDLCPNMEGQYKVEKTVTSFHCEKNDAPVKIENPDRALLKSTALQISQGGCKIWVSEDNWENTVHFSYWGEADDDDNFKFQLQNPNKVNVKLRLKINGAIEKCNFNGEVNWEGKAEGDQDDLAGTIKYDLKQRAEETNKACPDTCVINMDFKAFWLDKLPTEAEEEEEENEDEE